METAASIIAVVQLSEKIIKYIRDVSGATEDRRRLREQVRACSNVLLTLRDGIEDCDEGHTWGETVYLLAAPLARLHKALELAAAKLQNASGKRDKLKWPFEEKDVQKLIEAIESEKSLLILSLESDSNKLLRQISSQSEEGITRIAALTSLLEMHVTNNDSDFNDIKEAVHTIRGNQQTIQIDITDVHETQKLGDLAELKLNVLNWISPIDHALRHHGKISRRQVGTCKWFLDSEQYRAWLNTRGSSLFCHGIPGAGKTVLAAVAVENLWEMYNEDSKTALAFFFCEFGRQQEQTADGILLSVLKQLVERRPSLSDPVKAFYKLFDQGNKRPVHGEILKVIHAECSSYAKVFVLMDALDECDVAQDLLSDLFSIQKECNINIMATSRSIPEIANRFRGSTSIAVHASREDVSSFIEEQVRRKPKLAKLDQTLQDDIKASILKSVEGMFLLAKLHLDSLIGKRSVKAIRDTLKGLATGRGAYDAAYQAAMERIESQLSDQVDLAKQVLAWIVHSKRQITTRELREALGIEIDEPDLDRDNCPDVDDMVSACAGLVTIEKGSSIIRLVHSTTQEYFLRTKQTWFPDAESMIATSCTTCLSWDIGGKKNLHAGARQEDDYPYGRHRSAFVLHKYAARFWGRHAALAPSAHPHVMAFLRKLQQVRISAYALQSRTSQRVHGQFTDSLHLAAHFGLTRAISELLRDVTNADPQTPTATTPLMIAASLGHEAMVKLLLEAHASVDHLDKHMQTPLIVAIRGKHTGIVELLLNHHALAGGPPGQKEKPLHLACFIGHADIVSLIIKYGASILQQDESGEIPLHRAARHGLYAMAKLVLPGRIHIDTKDSKGNTPLHAANLGGSDGVVRLLLDNGAEINARGYQGRTPLHKAAREDSELVGRTLLDHGADAAAEDDQCNTALHLAAKSGSATFVKVLLEFGVDPNHQQRQNITSPDIARNSNDKTEVEKSPDTSTTISTRPTRRFSPLHHACWYEHTDIAKLLLDASADVNCATEVVTPLHAACWQKNESIVRLLLEAGAQVNCKDIFGDTPLDLCRKYGGSETIAQMLLDHGAVETAVPPVPLLEASLAEAIGGHEQGEAPRDKGADEETEDGSHEAVKEINELQEGPKTDVIKQ